MDFRPSKFQNWEKVKQIETNEGQVRAESLQQGFWQTWKTSLRDQCCSCTVLEIDHDNLKEKNEEAL